MHPKQDTNQRVCFLFPLITKHLFLSHLLVASILFIIPISLCKYICKNTALERRRDPKPAHAKAFSDTLPKMSQKQKLYPSLKNLQHSLNSSWILCSNTLCIFKPQCIFLTLQSQPLPAILTTTFHMQEASHGLFQSQFNSLFSSVALIFVQHNLFSILARMQTLRKTGQINQAW